MSDATIENPDIAAQQRRRTDPGRQWHWYQEPWQHETLKHFYDWVVNKYNDYDCEIIKIQRTQDEVALQLMQAMRFPGHRWGSWPSQERSGAIFAPGTEELLTAYERLGQYLRILRQVQRLMGPLNYAATFNDSVVFAPYSLPENDRVTLTFFEEFLKDSWHPDLHDRRKA